jgi:hypothetical protein
VIALDFRVTETTSPSIAQRAVSPFQWNAGAWFGSQFGSASWLLAGAVFLLLISPRIALVWLSGFILCGTVTIFLWAQRATLRAYVAYQWSLFVIAVVGFMCLLIAHLTGLLQQLVWNNPSAPLGAFAAWLVFPSMMVRFYLRERASRIANE